MLDVHVLATLLIAGAAGAPAIRHLSAASGVVKLGERLYVIADDELSLGVFDLPCAAPGGLFALQRGELPCGHDARKAAKPDFEALAWLPPFAGHPHGALMAIGSGSKPQRNRAVLIALDAAGRLDAAVRDVDLTRLYEPLRAVFSDLNIEGAFVVDDKLCLLQRANRASPVNACIRFDWPAVAAWLAGAAGAPAAASIARVDLGTIDGVPLGFTDGAALPGGRWMFCAAAEDTGDSYADGSCAGSAIGIVDGAGNLETLRWLASASKIEGIAASLSGDDIELLLVSDADDRQAPALLLSATLTGAAS